MEAALCMEVGSEGEEEEDRAGYLNQNAEPSGTTLVDTCNDFIKLIMLEMLWTVRHCCPAGPQFEFNCYKHWTQFLLCQPGEPPVTLMNREIVTQKDNLFMVLYGITLVPLAKDIRVADPGLISPFYAVDTVFDGSERRSEQIFKLLMESWLDRGYFPEPFKSLFISNTSDQEERAKRDFVAEGLVLNFVRGSCYLGGCIGLQ